MGSRCCSTSAAAWTSRAAERAREAAFFLLANLRSGDDEAAIFAFDSSLHLVQPFTSDLDRTEGAVVELGPWGVTSMHDAIAAAAQSASDSPVGQGTKRRALVVLTDGVDNASKLAPAEVSRIASAIDLPVYILAVVQEVDLQDGQGRGTRARTRIGRATWPTWRGGQAGSSSRRRHRRNRARQPNGSSMSCGTST